MEIRIQVMQYVRERIEALREQNKETKGYSNIAVIRSNAMKHIPNFFEKAQVWIVFIKNWI